MILEKCNVRLCSRILTYTYLVKRILEQQRSEEHSNAQVTPLNRLYNVNLFSLCCLPLSDTIH